MNTFRDKILHFQGSPLSHPAGHHPEYAKEIAELLPLLTSLWLLPSVFPATKEEMRRKFSFIGEMMEKMGVPLFDDTIQRLVDEFFEQILDLK